MAERPLDVICLGRAAVDLYGQQVGGRLEDMQTFAKYLGGSSANLAAGLARLGTRSAMLARVGDEHMGRFVREALAREGVDVSRVRTDPSRLTGLVVLGIGAGLDIPHVFFRERCADMGLCEDDVDAAFIGSARLLAITGTHLSTDTTRRAVDKAVRAARANGTQVALDIDYRPVLWGLTAAGEGASRYVESAEATGTLRDLLPDCDLVIGTEEEIAIAGGSPDLLAALRAIRAASGAVVVMKRGAQGCVIFESGPIESLEDGLAVAGRDVEVFNTVGAGDAFLAGFLHGWAEGETWQRCGELGNACGALVVARHGCTPAMPSRVELEAWLARTPPPRRPGADAALAHLHRATTWADGTGPLCILAFDHRSQFESLAARHGQPCERIGAFKELIADVLIETMADGTPGIRHGAIVDDRYGGNALARLAVTGIWTGSPIEVPGSRPLVLEPHFGTAAHLASWPANRVVKCLLFYHPDDPAELRHAQEERVRALYADLTALDRRLLLEVICPAVEGQAGAPLPRALRRLYNLGVRPDWWKLEPQSAHGWDAIGEVIAACDPHCKGVVLLGLGADAESLAADLEIAAAFDICRGFAVGRSIFADAAEQWFAGTLGDAAARDAIATRYRRMIEVWRTSARR
ncbi:MAG TPA: 5-dehydro-2-deoxygluconokinase [Woeseiaceae bacterium]|nr:5-dehydro-2-deoxygluconokinase [Woeseiaceae bacterium]